MKRASIIQGGEGRSRGFGFVKFAVPDDANRAVASLDGSEYKGRSLKVEIALKKGQRPEGVEAAPRKKGAKEQQHAEQHGDGSTNEQAESRGGVVAPKVASGNSVTKRKREESPVEADLSSRPVKSNRGEQQRKQQGPGGAPAARPAARKLPTLQEDSKTLLVFNVSEQTSEKQLFKRIKKVANPKQLKFEVSAYEAHVDYEARWRRVIDSPSCMLFV